MFKAKRNYGSSVTGYWDHRVLPSSHVKSGSSLTETGSFFCDIHPQLWRLQDMENPPAPMGVCPAAHAPCKGKGWDLNVSPECVKHWHRTNNLNTDPMKIVFGTHQLAWWRIIIFFLSTGGCPSVVRCPQMGVWTQEVGCDLMPLIKGVKMAWPVWWRIYLGYFIAGWYKEIFHLPGVPY